MVTTMVPVEYNGNLLIGVSLCLSLRTHFLSCSKQRQRAFSAAKLLPTERRLP